MKLSERDPLISNSELTDELHIVRNGQSFRQSIDYLFRRSGVPWRAELGGNEVIIFKKNRASSAVSSVDVDDFIIVIDKESERMIIAYALQNGNTPTIANLEDRTKYLRFYDGNAFL